jgi:hypothetical protein
MKRRPGLVLTVLLVTLLLPAQWVNAENRCNVNGEHLLSKVKSWADLHRWFKDYADCDDGNLVDDVAEYVTSSLARDWQDLSKLGQEIKREPRFKAFVLRHIDATVDTEDLEAVRKNADQRCPAGSEPLCASIASAAQSALDDIERAQ